MLNAYLSDTPFLAPVCRDVSFTWNLQLPCQPVRGLEEGMELAVRSVDRFGGGVWVPLLIVYNGGVATGCNRQMLTVRGYRVPTVDRSANPNHRYRASLCGSFLGDAERLQFRWMGTTFGRNRHTWNVDNVCVNFLNNLRSTITLLSDSFTAPNQFSCTDDNQCDIKYLCTSSYIMPTDALISLQLKTLDGAKERQKKMWLFRHHMCLHCKIPLVQH